MKTSHSRTAGNRAEAFSATFFPSLLIATNLFLFGPAQLYCGNAAEFDVSLWDILRGCFTPAVILLVLLIGAGAIVPRRGRPFSVACLAAFALLTWVQGNVLLWDYGLLGKGDIDWSRYALRSWVDGTVWVLTLAVILAFHRHVGRVAAAASAALILIQGVSLAITVARTPAARKTTEPSIPPAEIFGFSSEQNVIHVILDELQSTVFGQIVDSDPATYTNTLSGFTFFENTLGSFPTTVMSIPAIMSADVYSNDVPIADYLRAVYRGTTIANHLHDHGYSVDIAVPAGLDWLRWGRYTHLYVIPAPYGVTEDQRKKDNALFLLQVTLFRSVPNFLKRHVQNWTYQSLFRPGHQDRMHYEAVRHFSNKAFLDDFIERMSVTESKPVYKFLHLTTTHWPAVLNDDGEYAGRVLEWTWPHIHTQAKHSFDDFMRFIRQLQALGIYDRSLIILHGDHGYWKIPRSSDRIAVKNADAKLEGYAFDDEERFAEIVSSAMPLLAIKRPYEKEPLKISSAPATLTDLPTTICALQGLPSVFGGRFIFDIDPREVRERTFSYYDSLNRPGDDYFDRLDKFSVRGDPLDKTSWHFAGHLHAKRPFRSQEIVMGGDEASRLLRSGWSWPESHDSCKEGPCRWALGSQASLWVSLPKDRSMLMTATVKTLPFPEAQTMAVRVDGKNVATWRLTPVSWNWEGPWTWERLSVVVEPDQQRPDVSTVEFRFSQHHVPRTDEGERRPLAVLFQSLSVQETASASDPDRYGTQDLP